MKTFWTVSARADLDTMFDYVCKENPQRAPKLYEEIQAKVGILSDFPYAGKSGRVYNTRELILADYKYTIIYRIYNENIQILRLLHGAQQWP